MVTLLTGLLQVMSIFYARSASKLIELLLWLLIWFGEGSMIHVAMFNFRSFIRWLAMLVYSRLELRTSQTRTCRRHDMIERLVESDKTCRRRVCRRRKRPENGTKTCRRPVCRRRKRPVEGTLEESVEFVEDSQLRLFSS